MAKFKVTAGSWNGLLRVEKHTGDHDTMEDALADYARCEDYVWSRIEMRDGKFIYEITAKRIMVKDGLYFVECSPKGDIAIFTH